MITTNNLEFKAVFSDTRWSDDFYRFLQVIFHLYPEEKFHHLLSATTKELAGDEQIYRTVQAKLKEIKPFLSELTLALPALKKQKKEMASQVLQAMGGRTHISGYLEIGSTGRYISELQKHIKVSGNIFLTNDIAPSNSLAEIFERGQVAKLGRFFPLNDYAPVSSDVIADEQLDVVTCHIGLHHSRPEYTAAYITSVNRILRKGGLFIVRDHNVTTPEMATFVSLVHTVFNLGLNEPWEKNLAEYKSFKSTNEWADIICNHGFNDSGMRRLQDKDPTDNTLMSFTKI